MTGTHPVNGNNKVSRIIENGLAILGGLLAGGYVVGVEIFPQVCYAIGKCANAPSDQQFPWGVVLTVAACVAPKTLGRMTAGKLWEGIASKFGGKSP